MRIFRYLWLIVGGFSTAAAAAPQMKISLETDPSTFALKGYALHLRLQPSNWENLQIGIGTYSMEFPDLFVGLNPDNKDKGWQVDLHRAFGVFGEYFPRGGDAAWFFGGQVALQEYRLKNHNSGELRREFNNVLLMPYVGYRWMYKSGFYIQPWAGIGYTRRVSGETQLGQNNYDINPLVPFATMHIGYRF